MNISFNKKTGKYELFIFGRKEEFNSLLEATNRKNERWDWWFSDPVDDNNGVENE